MMNIVAFNYRKCLGGLLAIGLCLVVASAQAEVIQWNYDGSYDPDGGSPPAGQSDWTVWEGGTLTIVPNSPVAGVASFLDTLTNQRMAMHNPFTGTEFASDPGGVEWDYSCKTSFTGWQGNGSNPNNEAPLFGVRDEGGNGKIIMFAHNQGGTKLFYANNNGSQHGGDIWTGDALAAATGETEYHTYEVRKYLDTSDVMQVAFYLDGNLEDTRTYASFVGDSGSIDGVGIWGNTPGTYDYLVDNVHFGIIPEPTAAVLLASLLVVPLLWRRKKNVL